MDPAAFWSKDLKALDSIHVLPGEIRKLLEGLLLVSSVILRQPRQATVEVCHL